MGGGRWATVGALAALALLVHPLGGAVAAPLSLDRDQLLAMLVAMEGFVRTRMVPAVPQGTDELAELFAASVAGRGPFVHQPGERLFPATWRWAPSIRGPLEDALQLVTQAKTCAPGLVVLEESLRAVSGESLDAGRPERIPFDRHVRALRFRVEVLLFTAGRAQDYLPQPMLCGSRLDDLFERPPLRWPDFGDLAGPRPGSTTPEN